ncbi:hypothetical protein [Hyphomicrobium sp. CS1BSMeth3]|uniref:hypothetical protein n=1 Tax=Hyphomicrobium sp. CS1BSMeth3 TaxID=1892844 RepID=UPI00093201EB|nr:hypothetical protein [Hyphomicrobium sp. CS1BSMeth3]
MVESTNLLGAPSRQLVALITKLNSARAERDRLEEITRFAAAQRPPVPDLIKRPGFENHALGATHWRSVGDRERMKVAETYEAAVKAADAATDHDRHNDASEAACCVVGDIENEIIAIEPRSVADLTMQVSLALHQELVDGGWNDEFPVLIMQRFLRLVAWEWSQ